MQAVIILLILSQNLQAKQWLIFTASRKNLSQGSLAGHAFVSFIKDDPIRKQTIVIGCWGFYPANGGGYFGYVDGVIRNDAKRQKDLTLMVEVNDDEFDKAMVVKNEWETRRYKLSKQNCVDFVRNVASCVAELRLPEKGLTPSWPSDFLEDLKALNESKAVFGTPGSPAMPEALKKVQPENPGSVSKGALYLFAKRADSENHTGKEFPSADKQAVFDQMGLKYDEGNKQLAGLDDEDFSFPFSASVRIIDLNKDGLADAFVSLFNQSYFGQAGQETIFIKQKSGGFEKVAQVDGFCEILKSGVGAYPDLLVGGPGLTAPTIRWNGSNYKFFKNVPFTEKNAPATYTFKQYSSIPKKL